MWITFIWGIQMRSISLCLIIKTNTNTMKKISILTIALVLTLSSFAQTCSLGISGGVSTFTQAGSAVTSAWGSYIDLGIFGLEYNQSAALNTSYQDALNYIKGSSNSYVGGGKTDNYGFFVKVNPKNKSTFYMGFGLQKSNLIKAENITTQTKVLTYPNIIFVGGPQPMTTITTTTPTVVFEDKSYPYGSIGVINKLSNEFTFKGGLIVSNTIIATVGFSYNFSKY